MGEEVGEGLRICYTLAVTVIRGTLRETDGRIDGSCLQLNHPRLVYLTRIIQKSYIQFHGQRCYGHFFWSKH